MYQSVSEVTETLNIKEKFYEVETLKFNLVNETTVTIDAMNQFGAYKRIANFNFLDNVGML